QLTGISPQRLLSLKLVLQGLLPPHVLSDSEKAYVLGAVTAIVGHPLTSSIDGGDGLNDAIDFFNYARPRDVTLTGCGSADGYTGLEGAIPQGFTNINELLILGGTSGSSLTGLNAKALWNLQPGRSGSYISSADGSSSPSGSGTSSATPPFLSFSG